MRTLIIAVLAAVTLHAAVAEAQYGGRYYGGRRWGGYGYGYGGGMTAAMGYGIGLGTVIRSRGLYNLDTSQANINNQQAYKQYLENRMEATKTYFEMRQLNREYRAKERGPAVTPEQIQRMAAVGAPERLSASQLDPVNGKIDWPRALESDTYAQYRAELEPLFQKYADSSGSIGPERYGDILKSTDQMKAVLKDNINSTPPGDYVAAKRFLESLAFEAGQAPS